jgi:DNA-binding MarR family transcriptional regulator
MYKPRAQSSRPRPVATPEQEAFLHLMRTADALMRDLEEVLKPAGLSPMQYNVLRILRGAGPGAGMACSQIGQRMITRDPDMTRLLDRLEKRSLITRCRDTKDRRVVHARISSQGLKLIKGLDQPVQDAHRRQLGHLGERKLRTLGRLLEESREALFRFPLPPEEG